MTPIELKDYFVDIQVTEIRTGTVLIIASSECEARERALGKSSKLEENCIIEKKVKAIGVRLTPEPTGT